MTGWRDRARVGFAIGAAGCVLLAAGCGESAPTAHTVVVTVTDAGRDRVEVRAPASVPAGPVRLVVRNRGDTLHDAQLFRVRGARAATDVAVMLEASDPAGDPEWATAAGGIGALRPGETAVADLVLRPGVHFVADTQERPHPTARVTNAAKGGVARLVATGAGGGELPGTDARIVATDSGFRATGVRAGRSRVTFANEGREPHQMVAFRLRDEGPADAAMDALLERRRKHYLGWVPIPIPAERATAALAGGEAQVTALTFAPGRYGLLCFVSPRAGGLPQWELGMASLLEIPARPAQAP